MLGSRPLLELLEQARDLGFLGPGPVEPHIEHALAFAAAVPELPVRALDLGSGGGLPGLVLALQWPTTHWSLLDAGQRRIAFLHTAVAALGLTGRVEVLPARAEAAGRMPEQRGAYDLVVARSFGLPAVTAECAAPFLQVSGLLVVSEPPAPTPDRWPAASLAKVGLEACAAIEGPPRLQVLKQRVACPDQYPRRTGVPGKRPLW